MTTLLILVIVVLLAAWLVNLVAQFQREIRATRRRGLAAIEKERRLNQMIEAMLAEETSLGQRIEDQKRKNAETEKTLERTRNEATARLAAGRNRLLVLQIRRTAGDKEWIVTLVNPTLQKHDHEHPLAREWATGRDYLVFARTEHEARDRAVRRFSTRPGTTIKSVVPAAHDLFVG
ncbi:MAG: hypothetical protein WCO00_03695 [Rhodospirillaceae bacterium]